ncbi:MAG: MBL fold metallo-hydrolase [Planctomycetota bacterium]
MRSAFAFGIPLFAGIIAGVFCSCLICGWILAAENEDAFSVLEQFEKNSTGLEKAGLDTFIAKVTTEQPETGCMVYWAKNRGVKTKTTDGKESPQIAEITRAAGLGRTKISKTYDLTKDSFTGACETLALTGGTAVKQLTFISNDESGTAQFPKVILTIDPKKCQLLQIELVSNSSPFGQDTNKTTFEYNKDGFIAKEVMSGNAGGSMPFENTTEYAYAAVNKFTVLSKITRKMTCGGMEGMPASDSTNTFTYSDIKVNAKIPEEIFSQSQAVETAKQLLLLKGKVGIWFLGHSGVAIKTAKHFLVFDYLAFPPTVENTEELSTGVINPEGLKSENVLVFVSHDHSDHFNPKIASWQRKIKEIRYIAPPCVFDCAPGLKNKPKENLIEIDADKEITTTDGVSISTIRATDAGVSFLVKVDGLVIFHAGDHALWAKQIEPDYQNELKRLKGAKIDIAFLPSAGQPDGTQTVVREGALWAVKELAPKVVIPIHLSSDLAEGAALAKIINEQKSGTQSVFLEENRGKLYIYENGTIKESK